MGDLVNLRRARKAKARQEEAEQSARNRLRHGRTRAEKQATGILIAKAVKDLDGKRLDDKRLDDKRLSGEDRRNDGEGEEPRD